MVHFASCISISSLHYDLDNIDAYFIQISDIESSDEEEEDDEHDLWLPTYEEKGELQSSTTAKVHVPAKM